MEINNDLRSKISAMLADTSEESHLRIDLILEPEESQGLSSLLLPHIDEIWQDQKEGIILLKMTGYEEPVELEIFYDCLEQIYDYLYPFTPIDYSSMTDEEAREMFEDLQADNAIEEYKSGLRD